MILLTGATGLVGAHLAIELTKKGEKVRALYRSEAGIKKTEKLFALYQAQAYFSSIEWYCADINDIPALEGAFLNINYVCHCAGLISFRSNESEKLRKTNIEGTANLINLACYHGVKKFCHVSSIAALGEPVTADTPIDENTDWNASGLHSNYAIAKYGGEMEVWRGHFEGLNTVIVNPGIIIGPGFFDSGSGKLFSHIKKGLPFYTKGITGYISVWDVSKIIVELLQADTNGERFVLVAENRSFKDILHKIAEELGVKPPTIYINSWITAVAWRIDWLLGLFGKPHLLTQSAAMALHQKTTYNSQKIIKKLSYQFVSVDQAIKETAALQQTI